MLKLKFHSLIAESRRQKIELNTLINTLNTTSYHIQCCNCKFCYSMMSKTSHLDFNTGITVTPVHKMKTFYYRTDIVYENKIKLLQK